MSDLQAGILIGVVGVVVLAALVFWVWFCRRDAQGWADSEAPDTEGQGLAAPQGYRLADIPPQGEPLVQAWPQIESPSRWGSM